jgi:SAM-dependent methyltransferase
VKLPLAQMIARFDQAAGRPPDPGLGARWQRTASQVALDRVETDARDVLLDLGCGDGALLAALGPHLREGLGVDCAPAALALARAALAGSPHLRVAAGDLRDPPELPGLSTVLMAHSLRYLDAPERAELFALLHARLPVDGLLVVADLIWSVPPQQVDGADDWLDAELAHVLHHDALDAALRRAGFLTRSERLHPAVAVIRALKPR